MSMDELFQELQGQKSVQEESGYISLEDLFHEGFMGKHSNSTSFEEFMEKGNFQVKTHDDINKINDELLDRHVARETSFASWKSMLDTANAEYAARN